MTEDFLLQNAGYTNKAKFIKDAKALDRWLGLKMECQYSNKSFNKKKHVYVPRHI